MDCPGERATLVAEKDMGLDPCHGQDINGPIIGHLERGYEGPHRIISNQGGIQLARKSSVAYGKDDFVRRHGSCRANHARAA